MREPSVQEIQIRSWSSYVQDGLKARENKDTSSWTLGDLASLISKDYGHDSIGKFSQEIGVERKTLMNYRTCAQTFSKEIREAYKDLTFSHFLTVTGVKIPQAWLEQARVNKWSVEKLRTEIENAYPKITAPVLTDEAPPPMKCPHCSKWRFKNLSTFDICRGHYNSRDGKVFYE